MLTPRNLLLLGLLAVGAAYGMMALELEEERAIRKFGEARREAEQRKQQTERPS